MAEDVVVVDGRVFDWTPAEGNKPGKGIIGGYRFSIFPTDYRTKEVNRIYEGLLQDIAANAALHVKFFVKQNGTYTNYILDDYRAATDDAAVAEGDKKSEALKDKPRSGGARKWEPKDESWQAARWAMSTALDALPGADLTVTATKKTVEDIAEWLAKKSVVLAGKLRAAQKGPANSAAETPEEKKDEVPF